MKQNDSTIITCATSGASLTPSMSPYLPITPQEIVQQSVEASAAGAAVLHLHVRNPEDGSPTRDLGIWEEVVPEIRKRCDAIINMSASLGQTAEERLEASLRLRPEIATVIVGSMNYGRFNKAKYYGDTSTFKHQWERELFGPGSYEVVTNNTFAKIARMIDILVDADIAIEFEMYDVGHLYILEHHLSKRDIKRPVIIQFLTGILGGIPSDIEHLLHLKQTSISLFGGDCVLFTHGTGPGNIKAAAYGAMMGTNVRIGQEDNLIERPGKLFKSNAEQVDKIRRIMSELNIETATVTEARQRLGV